MGVLLRKGDHVPGALAMQFIVLLMHAAIDSYQLCLLWHKTIIPGNGIQKQDILISRIRRNFKYLTFSEKNI